MRACCFLFLLLGTTVVAADPMVEWREQAIVVSAAGEITDWEVVIRQQDAKATKLLPAIAGEWRPHAPHRLKFVPKYPLQPGGQYRVYWSKRQQAVDISVPDDRDKSAPKLLHIYPSGDNIPENILRFYLVFSKPMSRGEVYDRVKVLDDNRKPVDQPFLEIDDELWNEDQTRITLLIDPGRIKQEVKPRLDLGPVFMANKKYTLTIDGRWPDANGVLLGNSIQKQYQVTKPQTKLADIADWKLTLPSATNHALTITLPTAIDEGIARRAITVHTDHGPAIPGDISLSQRETVWTWTPKTPLKPSSYVVRVAWSLEDPSGNAVNRPFEAEQLMKLDRDHATKSTTIPFTIPAR